MKPEFIGLEWMAYNYIGSRDTYLTIRISSSFLMKPEIRPNETRLEWIRYPDRSDR